MMFTLFWLCAENPFLILLRPEPLPNPKSPSTSNAQKEAEWDHTRKTDAPSISDKIEGVE
jgi:hypothetical protein